jgi:hypothetical protein
MPVSTISQAGLDAPISLTSPTLTTPNIDSAQIPTVSGTAPLYMCRAWVNFNGTGTVAIRASGNVTSITDNGVGDYTVNFTTAMPDANYSVSATSDRASSGVNGGMFNVLASTTPTTSAVRLITFQVSVGVYDPTYANVAIFR